MKDKIMVPDMSNLIALPEIREASKAQHRPNPVFDANHPKVNDDKDHFPLGDANQARNALARANQYGSAPKWWNGTLEELKNAVARKVKKEFPSIEVSKESTSATKAAPLMREASDEDRGRMRSEIKRAKERVHLLSSSAKMFPGVISVETLDEMMKNPSIPQSGIAKLQKLKEEMQSGEIRPGSVNQLIIRDKTKIDHLKKTILNDYVTDEGVEHMKKVMEESLEKAREADRHADASGGDDEYGYWDFVESSDYYHGIADAMERSLEIVRRIREIDWTVKNLEEHGSEQSKKEAESLLYERDDIMHELATYMGVL